METLSINKQDITDLARMISEIQDRIESLELIGDQKFIESLKKSDKEVKNRDFVDWNEL